MKEKLNFLNTVTLVGTFVLAVSVVPWFGFKYGFTGFEWAVFGVFMILTGLGITAGYHRLWSHKTYEANKIYQAFFAFWGAVAAQNTIIEWSRDHRDHHRWTDNNEKDPYSAKKGFWFSHIGWIMLDNSENKDYSSVKDLMENPICQFQEKYYMQLTLFGNVVLPAIIGAIGHSFGLMGGKSLVLSMVSMFLIAGLLRFVMNHHFTFFINSLAHIWGTQPYAKKDTSRDNFFLALVTYGEGYHNFHHTFQSDYRNGVRAWQFDPTKWLVWTCSKLGITWKLKRMQKWQINHKKQEFWGVQSLEAALDHLKVKEMPEVKARLEQTYEEWKTALEAWTAKRKIQKKNCAATASEVQDLQKILLAKRDAFCEAVNSIFNNPYSAPALS